MKKLIATIFIASCVGTTWANGLESLENFVKTVKSGRADFTQVVTAPAKDGQAARSKTSTGSFEFQRPSRFKFVYKKPFAQSIVADGQTLWMYDVDLNQVTARAQSQVLGSTPAALIAAAPDLRALQADFELQAAPDRDGLQWVAATPKAKAPIRPRDLFAGNDIKARRVAARDKPRIRACALGGSGHSRASGGPAIGLGDRHFGAAREAGTSESDNHCYVKY